MKEIWKGFLVFIALAVITGIAYPLLVTGVAQVFFKDKANGSLIVQDGKIVGSELVGQKFTQDKYFWGRPSAGDYGTMSASASNLTPAGEKVKENMKAYAEQYKNQTGEVADEMLFTSGSGLDPQISPASARQQAPRVAKARNMSVEEVMRLVEENTDGRDLGFLGEVRVNVLKLNLALDNHQK